MSEFLDRKPKMNNEERFREDIVGIFYTIVYWAWLSEK